tara:strand:- start:234 stop:1079 length:846 start_codon:yes stop_codon:yes gene_type:complete
MHLLKSIDDCIQWRKSQKTTLGFVPTMGALHDGHLSLVHLSQKACNKTIVSIFLNPTQFAENEDFKSYPNTIAEDLDKLRQNNVDAVFMPSVSEMYKKNENDYWYDTPLALKLEGASRPLFFKGVTMIVHKLFKIISPTHAIFGQKDAQQLLIIKEMIKHNNYGIQMMPGSTVRSKDGLALSSRNKYLNIEETKIAHNIYFGLLKIKSCLDSGQKDVSILKNAFITHVNQFDELSIDYISIACEKTLDEIVGLVDQKALISTAVFLNKVRLIDNFTYSPST